MIKTFIILLFSIFITIESDAQFYSISQDRNISESVKETHEKPTEVSEIKDQYDKKLVVQANDKELKVPLYNKISYPLQKIKITSPYGMRYHPIDKVRSFHNGIDLSAKNEAVYSVLDGTIESVGYDKNSGNFITIRHVAGLTTGYCHLSEVFYSKGDNIKVGETIGISGNTGKSTSYHLHFTVRKDGKYINPLLMIKFIEGYIGN